MESSKIKMESYSPHKEKKQEITKAKKSEKKQTIVYKYIYISFSSM